MFYDFLLIFLPLLVVIDPAGMLPLYLSLTAHYDEGKRREIARRATLVAAITAILFVIVGQAIFAFLGVQFADFQIAGGILLVVLAIIDLLSSSKPAVDERALQDPPDTMISVVPLAIPLIVGPATLTTSLLLVSTYSPKYGQVMTVAMVCTALTLNLLILFAAMWYSQVIVRLVGRQAMLVMNKIVMILLAAIAVSLIRLGITSIVKGLR